ncbi:MAG: hypothetical protein AAF933_16170, partial [Pseudomonadota bacterium]
VLRMVIPPASAGRRPGAGEAFVLAPGAALLIVAGGALLNLLAGLGFAARPLRLRPAGVLRMQEG